MVLRKRTRIGLLVLLLPFVLAGSCKKSGSSKTPVVVPPAANTTFTNPIIKGGDPYVTQKDGYYYFMETIGDQIKIWKTKNMSMVGSMPSVTVFDPPTGVNSQNMWAPELNFLDGKWYLYYTAGDGTDISQRTWVAENASADPTLGTFVDKGRLFTANTNFWAIDGDVMEYNGSRYFLWAGRPDLTNSNKTQNLYIAKMTNPWTLEGDATMLSFPLYSWEKNGFGVNEGPEFLLNGTKAFVVYSASYCGTDDYCLGLLSLRENGNPLLATDWIKKSDPVFTKAPQNNAYGPGHNSFFKSPDGTENWIIYHANSYAGEGCGNNRFTRMQKFVFNADGSPNFGSPVATGLKITKPAGED
nr:glycoside hydrolase family 43 protein [uncultured Pedobacter sp.]